MTDKPVYPSTKRYKRRTAGNGETGAKKRFGESPEDWRIEVSKKGNHVCAKLGAKPLIYASTTRYKRRTALGHKYASVWLSLASQDHLRALQGDSVTVEQAVAAALLLAAASPQHYGRALKALPR